jgi:phage FluMu protein Com
MMGGIGMDKQSTMRVPTGEGVRCYGCGYPLAVMASEVYGWLVLRCPKCGVENHQGKRRVAWSEVWKGGAQG